MVYSFNKKDLQKINQESQKLNKLKKIKYAVALVACVGVLATGLAVLTHMWMEKQVSLAIDNEIREVKTMQTTVADLVSELGVAVGPDDYIYPALDTPLADDLKIEVIHAINVAIKADGQTIPLTTLPTNVTDALKQANLTLGPKDIVTPAIDATLAHGDTIKITRVSCKEEIETKVVAHKTVKTSDNKLAKGTTKVVQAGQDGKIVYVYNVTYHDGVEFERELVKQSVVAEVKDKVINVGTMKVASRSGNPARGVTGSGSNKDFAYSKSFNVEATAYTATGNRTASGRAAQVGVVAVDTSVIPFGTRLYIEGYGYAVAGDRGSAIRGYMIDVYFNSKQECINWGRRNVKVYILK